MQYPDRIAFALAGLMLSCLGTTTYIIIYITYLVTVQSLLNLVNRSGQSITSLFLRLNKRLKSVEKKQRKATIMKEGQQGHCGVHEGQHEGDRGQEDQEEDHTHTEGDCD